MKKPKKYKNKDMVYNHKTKKWEPYVNNWQSTINKGAINGKGWWESIADES